MEIPGIPALFFAALVVVLAYAVRGTAGFGGQAIAIPLLTLVFPLPLVLAAIVVLTVLSSFGPWRRDWRKIDWGEIVRLLPYTVAGVLAGLYLLAQLDVPTLTRAFGAFVILYACFALATAARPIRISRPFLRPIGVLLSAIAGLAGAVFGAAAGPLYAIYLSALRMEKDRFRVTITTILTIQAVLRVAGYAQLGFYNSAVLVLIVAGLPLMLLGARIGLWLASRLDQHWFNAGVALLLFASGTLLIFK